MVNATRKITTNDFLTFIDCPMKLVWQGSVVPDLEDRFEQSIKYTFDYYFRQFMSGVKTYNKDLRRFFHTSYNSDEKIYNSRGFVSRDSYIYKAVELIDNFTMTFGDNTPTFGETVAVDSEFCVECACGHHYLSGSTDVIFEDNHSHKILKYMINKPLLNEMELKYSILPSLILYAGNMMYKNIKNPELYLYYPAFDKTQKVSRRKHEINSVGRMICTIADALGKNSVWRIDNQSQCSMCKYFSECRGA